MVRSDVFKSLNLVCMGFDLDFELVNKLLLSGHDIHEVAIDYSPRTYEEGKKIRLADGMRGLMVILRDRLGLSPALKKRRNCPSQKLTHPYFFDASIRKTPA